jgi:hypothetical protein
MEQRSQVSWELANFTFYQHTLVYLHPARAQWVQPRGHLGFPGSSHPVPNDSSLQKRTKPAPASVHKWPESHAILNRFPCSYGYLPARHSSLKQCGKTCFALFGVRDKVGEEGSPSSSERDCQHKVLCMHLDSSVRKSTGHLPSSGQWGILRKSEKAGSSENDPRPEISA